MKTSLVFICLLFVMGLCQVCMAHDCSHKIPCTEESGVNHMEKRQVSSFKSISIDGSFVATIACGKNYAVEITGDKNILPNISTEVRNQKLSVYFKKSLCTTKDIKISISAPDIVKLDASGSNTIHMKGIENQKMSINLDGAGELNISGKTKKLSATLSGSNNFNAKNLKSETTSISIAGSSDATVYASDYLKAEIGGVGNIVYYGNPKTIKRNVFGIGEISSANLQ